MGSCYFLKQLSDLSFELKDYKPKVENSSPASIIDRILENLELFIQKLDPGLILMPIH